MKKIATLLLLALITISSFAQRTIDKEVGNFNEIKVFDLIEVNLINSTENKVVVKGRNTESVKIVNDNGTLKLRMQLEERFDGNQTFIEVYYTSIDVIDANEGAEIVSAEAIEQNKIELRAQEGGRIKVGLQVNFAEMKSVTGGIIEASGLAKSQEVTLNTGGIFEGASLKTQDTKVRITAAGEAEVYAAQKVDIKVTAGGDVIVYGNPKEISKKKFAGGRITFVD
ncbi:head GIN domain-containing protein [Patiriisocius hiemis]|uniref:Head GIN domain-containing protein n=1 Tax=Patiriisocius hiemis TaxID=3075604 RepID=A0ABU2YEW8_9FLAO|nr:head GIN domain-containing protein [Constantimarinum sp. W242]MDT0555598.1 head GIN domain-containing protein [Constantimarinum sp. W242]